MLFHFVIFPDRHKRIFRKRPYSILKAGNGLQFLCVACVIRRWWSLTIKWPTVHFLGLLLKKNIFRRFSCYADSKRIHITHYKRWRKNSKELNTLLDSVGDKILSVKQKPQVIVYAVFIFMPYISSDDSPRDTTDKCMRIHYWIYR